MPGQAFGYFTGFGQLAVDGSFFAFQGSYSGGSGIYKRQDGSAFARAVDHETPMHEEPDTLTTVSLAGMDGNAIVFIGGGGGYRNGGVYSDAGTEVHQVISYTNRIMEGYQAGGGFGVKINECFDNNRFVYQVDYYYEPELPANSAIWMATVNARGPTGGLLLIR